MPGQRLDTFGSRATLRVGDASYEISRLDALAREGVGHVERLPFSLKLLLENLLRREDGESVTAELSLVRRLDAISTETLDAAHAAIVHSQLAPG